MGNVLAPYSFTFQGGFPRGTDPETYSAVEQPEVGSIFLAEDFSSYVLGSDPEDISGFNTITNASVISDENGRRSFKNVSQIATTTENANGFIHDIPSDLVEGDEAWVRMKVFIPAGSDLTASGTGGLKWFRWQTHTDVGANAGYSDIYYNKVEGAWRYIKEGVDVFTVLSTGLGNPFDMELGRWVIWELYTKFHSSAGIVRMWKDGVLINEVLSEQTLTSSTDVVKKFFFRTFWNGGVPEQQDWYYDRVDIALNGASRTDSTELSTDVAGNKFIGLAL